MKRLLFSLVSTFVFLGVVPPAAALQVEPRTVAVQFFQWRWNDIARECQAYLGPIGVAAVLVPPPHDHIDLKDTPWRAPWWERYQVVSFELESRSGSRQEFIQMVNDCAQAGVDIYVDAVINHMAGFSHGVGFSGATFTHHNYPGIFSYWDFNHCGVTPNNHIHDFYDKYQLQFCELLGLADLATHRSYVRRKIREYLEGLTDLGVKGFRIDAAKHIPSQDIFAITRGLRGDPYIFQELIGGNEGPITYEEYMPNGDVTYYAYPYIVGKSFKDRDLRYLENLDSYAISSMDAVVFVDNHDLQRTNDQSWLLSYQYNPFLFRMAQAFMLAYPYGYPFLMSSYLFQDYNEGPPLNGQGLIQSVTPNASGCPSPWICEHRFAEIPFLINFRNKLNSHFYVSEWWQPRADQVVFSRGPKALAAFNLSDQPLEFRSQDFVEPGEYCASLLTQDTQFVSDLSSLCTHTLRISEQPSRIRIDSRRALFLLKE